MRNGKARKWNTWLACVGVACIASCAFAAGNGKTAVRLLIDGGGNAVVNNSKSTVEPNGVLLSVVYGDKADIELDGGLTVSLALSSDEVYALVTTVHGKATAVVVSKEKFLETVFESTDTGSVSNIAFLEHRPVTRAVINPVKGAAAARTDHSCTDPMTIAVPSSANYVDHGGWFEFVATSTQTSIELCGSDFDTIMDVYTGDCAALIVENDDCGDGAFGADSNANASCHDGAAGQERSSCLCLTTTIGATYKVNVIEFNAAGPPAGSTIVLTINDNCDPVAVSGACCEAGVCTNSDQLTCNGSFFAGEDCNGGFTCPVDPCESSLFSNGGPLSTSSALLSVRNRDNSTPGPTWIVDDFVLNADSNITDLQWWGNEPFGFNWGGKADYTILYADGPSMGPGTIHSVVLDVNAARIDTGDVLFGDPIWLYTIGGLNVSLPAGTYWIGMRVVQELPLGTGQFDTGWWVTTPGSGSSPIYVDYLTGGVYGVPLHNAFPDPFDQEFHTAFCIGGNAGPAPYGACCDDLNLTCEDCVQSDCPSPLRFTANTFCADIDPPCGSITGACCDPNVGGCTVKTPSQCAADGGNYLGNNSACSPDPCPCVVGCPAGSSAEGEAECGPDYVDTTNGGCNSPVPATNSNCCIDNGGVGCDDAACEAIVCGNDSFCCNGAWDSVCAADAAVSCPAICSSSFPFFTDITCDETVCGTGGTYLNGVDQLRDTDWYKITVAAETQLTWAVEAEFPVLFGIVDTGGVDDCNNVTSFLTSATAGECEPANVTACIPAGTWYLFVSPDVFSGAPCDGDYTATATCAACPIGACCPGDGSCAVGTETSCVGDWQGPSTSCSPNPCPQPPANDDCGTAEAISVNGATATANTALANDDVTDFCGTSTPAQGVWYVVTGTGNTMTASTCNAGSDFDTKIQVFCTCSPEVCVGGNDDDCGLQSSVTWCSEVGQEYHILVGGFSGSGNLELSVTDDSLTCGSPVSCAIPTGACCTGIICDSTSTEAACDTLGGSWFEGESCPAFSCPTPVADTCDVATIITAVPYTAIVDTSGATSDPPAGSCNSSGANTAGTMDNDTWWTYTPTQDCSLTVAVDYSLGLGSDYDGLTSIYSGPDCNSLTELDCLDSGFSSDDDATAFSATSGTTYWFQVGDWGTGDGGGSTSLDLDCAPLSVTGACCDAGSCSELNSGDCAGAGGDYQGDATVCTPNPCPQPPANDDCSTALGLAVGGSDISANTLATDDALSGMTCGTSGLNQAIWYTVTGNGNELTVTTCNAGTDFDTKIQVWCAECVNPICIGGNDDDCGTQSSVTWCSGAGVTYYVAVGGFGSSTGNIEVSVADGASCGVALDCTPPLPAYCDTCWTNDTDDAITNVTFNTINNSTGFEGDPCAYGDYTAQSTDIALNALYQLDVTFSSAGFTEHVFAWIDWNQDLDFDDAGEAFDLGDGADATLSTNITVPAGATLGSTRMRVTERYNSDPGACDAATYGESEDYTVNIVNPLASQAGGSFLDDDDNDGVPNTCDNCPDDVNEDQANSDGDSHGDVCDNCLNDDNEDQADCGSNGVGDVCDVNTDGDSLTDECDNCPATPNDDQADGDGDGVGNLCDNCLIDANSNQSDLDNDGTGDVCDGCPSDPNKIDPGLCGCGAADEGDSDNDGVLDCVDTCPGADDAIFGECRNNIPTMSQWGLVVLALFLLVAGKVYFGRRSATA